MIAVNQVLAASLCIAMCVSVMFNSLTAGEERSRGEGQGPFFKKVQLVRSLHLIKKILLGLLRLTSPDYKSLQCSNSV